MLDNAGMQVTKEAVGNLAKTTKTHVRFSKGQMG